MQSPTDSTLWLDFGNSRLKYWLTDGSQIRLQDARLHLESPVDLLLGLVQTLHALAPARICISSVLSNHDNQRIASALQHLGVPVDFALVHASHHGLKTCYDPEQLGLDRWLQVLATHQKLQQGNTKTCIISCGTAITIDILEQDTHQGGYIIPGLFLQRESLMQGTKGIQVAHSPFNHILLATNTHDAVHHGILFEALSCFNNLLVHYPQHQFIFTGGDAPLFIQHLNNNFIPSTTVSPGAIQIVPDLLFLGLQCYFQSSS